MKKNFDLILIVTSINDQFIYKMLDSVLYNNTMINLQVIFVNQSKCDISHYQSNDNNHLFAIDSTFISLSKARNLALSYIKENNLLSTHIMFPDDDSTFDQNFFIKFKKVIAPKKNFLINVYKTGTSDLYKRINLINNSRVDYNKYRYAMSVNMIVSYDDIIRVNGFDENLGVGTWYGAAEDADFFIRCSKENPFFYSKELYNFHPANVSKFNLMNYNEIFNRFASYSRGFIYFVIKHNLTIDFYKSLIHAILISFYYFFTLNFKMFRVYLNIFFYRIKIYRKFNINNIISYEN